MKKRIGLGALLACLLVVGVSAQTVTQKIQFDTADSVAQTAAVTYAVQVNATAAVVEKAICTSGSVTFPAGATCIAPLPVTVNKGDVVIVTATNAGGSASSLPFTDPGLAGTPGNLKLVVTISVP